MDNRLPDPCAEAEVLEEQLQQALRAEDLHSALALSTQLRQLPEAGDWTLLRHADLLRRLGMLQEALSVLADVQMDGALQAHVLKNRGEILRELGDLRAALASLQKAVALDPSCPDHAIALGFILLEVGANDQGLAVVHAAQRQLHELGAQAQRWLRLLHVYLLHSRGEYETALAIAQGLTADLELGFEGRLQEAGLLIRLGDPKAEAALEALSPATPRQERDGLLQRVEWLQSQYRHQEALQLLEPLLAEQPLPLGPAEQACLLQVALLQLPEALALYQRLRDTKESSGDAGLQRSSRTGLHRGIYEEFNADRPLAAAIREQADRPAPEQLQGLSQLLSEEEESNAVAFSLLLAARQHGHLESWAGSSPPVLSTASQTESAPEGSAALIPHRIMQLWQGKELPDPVAAMATSWIQANPGFEYRIWTIAEAKRFITDHAPERVCQAFAKAASPLVHADLFRLAWLHLKGGVVASLNTRCRHSLTPWLSPGIDGVLYQQSIGFLGTDFMAATPGQPLIEALLDLACFLVLGEQGSNPWFLSGPGMLTLGFARYYRLGLADLAAPPPPGLRLLRESQLCQIVSLNLPWPVTIRGTA